MINALEVLWLSPKWASSSYIGTFRSSSWLTYTIAWSPYTKCNNLIKPCRADRTAFSVFPCSAPKLLLAVSLSVIRTSHHILYSLNPEKIVLVTYLIFLVIRANSYIIFVPQVKTTGFKWVGDSFTLYQRTRCPITIRHHGVISCK